MTIKLVECKDCGGEGCGECGRQGFVPVRVKEALDVLCPACNGTREENDGTQCEECNNTGLIEGEE